MNVVCHINSIFHCLLQVIIHVFGSGDLAGHILQVVSHLLNISSWTLVEKFSLRVKTLPCVKEPNIFFFFHNSLKMMLELTEHNCWIIKVFFPPPTDAQFDSLKNNFKFALKLTLKGSYMFQCKTPSSGSALFDPC